MLSRPLARPTHLWVQVPLDFPPLEGHHGHVQETHVRAEPLADLHVPRGCPLMFMSVMPGRQIGGFDWTEDARGDTHRSTTTRKRESTIAEVLACAPLGAFATRMETRKATPMVTPANYLLHTSRGREL